MKFSKNLLNGLLALSIVFSPTVGMTQSRDFSDLNDHPASGVTEDDLEDLDQAIQDEYEALLAIGYQPSEATQILRDEFESQGCNGDVPQRAIQPTRSPKDRVDPRNRKSEEELKEIYQDIDYSAQCAATIEVARGIQAGLIHQFNYLPEDPLAGYGPNPDQLLLESLLVYGAAVYTVYRVVKIVHHSIQIGEFVMNNVDPDLATLDRNAKSARDELARSAQMAADETSRYGRPTGETQYRYERAVEKYKKAKDELDGKLKEVLPEVISAMEEAGHDASQPKEILEALEKETQEQEKKPDDGGKEDRCQICEEREREAKWRQFTEQVASDAWTCLDNEVGTNPSHPLRKTMPRISDADLLFAKTCNGRPLIHSLQKRQRDRMQRACNYSVETDVECMDRLENQHRARVTQAYQNTHGEILELDCKLISYPHQWSKNQKPLQTVEDCQHVQKTIIGKEQVYEAFLERQERIRPMLLLASQQCHANALSEDEDSLPPTGPGPSIDPHQGDKVKSPLPPPRGIDEIRGEINSMLSKREDLPGYAGEDADHRNSLLESSSPLAQIFVDPQASPDSAIKRVRVQGVNVNSYRYKAGPAPLNCADPIGYSSEIPVEMGITVILFGYPDFEDYQICVIGKGDYSWQPFETAATYTWTAQPPAGGNAPQERDSHSPNHYPREFLPTDLPPSGLVSAYSAKYRMVMNNPKSTAKEKCIARQQLEATQEITGSAKRKLQESKDEKFQPVNGGSSGL